MRTIDYYNNTLYNAHTALKSTIVFCVNAYYRTRRCGKLPLPENRHCYETGSDWKLYYLHQSAEFPLGEIGNPETKPDKDRALIEEVLGDEFGPIIHMALAPHLIHNIVEILDEVPVEHRTIVADGIIIPKDNRFSVETFVGDCPVIIVDSPMWLGMIHAGRPEIVDGVVREFFARWPGMHTSEPTWVFVGPGISGGFYELPQIPKGFEQYEMKTIWGTQGFDISTALSDQIERFGIIPQEDIVWSGTDPFEKNRLGYFEWASNEWYKRLPPDEKTGKKKYSPRDCAFLSYTPPT